MSRHPKAIDGLPVIDAKGPITLHITQRDISRAKPQDPGQCAAARACVRDLHCLEARVHLSRIYVRQNAGNWVRFFTPLALRDEIIALDRGGRFEPLTITLKPVSAIHALGTASRGGKNTGKGSKHKTYHVMKNVRSHANFK